MRPTKRSPSACMRFTDARTSFREIRDVRAVASAIALILLRKKGLGRTRFSTTQCVNMSMSYFLPSTNAGFEPAPRPAMPPPEFGQGREFKGVFSDNPRPSARGRDGQGGYIGNWLSAGELRDRVGAVPAAEEPEP